MPKPLTIAGIAFRSQREAIDHCRRILRAGGPGTDIDGADAEFVEALLSVREDKLLDLQGMNVTRYYRDWQSREHGDRKWNLCFWAELEDGTRVDFSFLKAIRLIADLQATAVGG